jgi:hypothetical protein
MQPDYTNYATNLKEFEDWPMFLNLLGSTLLLAAQLYALGRPLTFWKGWKFNSRRSAYHRTIASDDITNCKPLFANGITMNDFPSLWLCNLAFNFHLKVWSSDGDPRLLT